MSKKSKADAAASGKSGRIKTAGKSPPARSKKGAASRKPAAEKIEAEATPMPEYVFDPTSEQIQMRAYFISERRRRFDLPGDANSDWLEAKRQLLAEIRH